MKHTLAALLSVLLLAGCGDQKTTPQDSKTKEGVEAESPVEVEASKTWSGRVHMSSAEPGGRVYSTEPLVIRDQKAYDAFVESIPTKKIGKWRGEAPASTDPLLETPAIDFEQHMMVVVIRDSMYVGPEIGKITRQGNDMKVEVSYPPRGDTEMMAFVYGVGTYLAKLVPRLEGKVSFPGVRLRGDPKPKPTEGPKLAEMVEIQKTYTGRINLSVKEPGGAVTTDPIVIRDQEAYDAFVESIPTHKIQKKQPAPPSDDPLLKKPAVDFSKHMLLVALRDSMYVGPKITSVAKVGDQVTVEVTLPSLEDSRHYAAQSGIGTYVAVLVEKSDGKVEFETKE